MKFEDAKIGMRVHTTAGMTDPEHGWLAGRRATIVGLRPAMSRFRILIDVDGFQRQGDPGAPPTRVNPIPVDAHEIDPGPFPWERKKA